MKNKGIVGLVLTSLGVLLYMNHYYVVLAYGLFIGIIVLLGKLVGNYIYKVWSGDKTIGSKIIQPIEEFFYRLLGIDVSEEMTGRKYFQAVLSFSGVGFLFLLILLMLQGVLPLNPDNKTGLSLSLAFNTAASFVTNTNWQAYSGEVALSNLSQMLGITVQNFLSAATGIAILFAVLRGLVIKKGQTVGNFWKDLIRILLYVLLPLSIILTLLLTSQGVVQTVKTSLTTYNLETGLKQLLTVGPVASQAAIKMLGTNGGGFFGANSGYPFENPTIFTNYLEILAMLLIPVSLVFTFGHAVQDRQQSKMLMATMGLLFIGMLTIVTLAEMNTATQFANVLSQGNMEGKELINGIGGSALWATVTTATSTGATNASLSSFTSLGSLPLLFLMQLGEIVFGGVGTGIYGILGFILLAVFIAGLMVGRTPEYLGKKVDPYDMKMASILILVPSVLSLLGTALVVMLPQLMSWLSTTGAHGFTEILYNITSMAGNNGSSFAGFDANNGFINIFGGVIMLTARFIPIMAVLYLAQNMVKKKAIATSEGTLSTTSGLFIGFLIGVIVIIGALSYLPALALGPIADFFRIN